MITACTTTSITPIGLAGPMTDRRAAGLLGISAFSLGSSIGADGWWTFPVIVANLLLIEYAWSQITKAEVNR